MGDLIPAPLPLLLTRMMREFEGETKVFDLPAGRFWRGTGSLDLGTTVHGRRVANPSGPAAGPHGQMAQNLLLSWLAGARFLELKTVQADDRVRIPRPCIDMATVGYNVEWSQELTLAESRREYVKIIMPGFVPPGAEPRLVAPSENDFWWSMLDTKSKYSELAILSRLGGRRYSVKDVTFLKGTEEYAWYTAHKRILLTLQDDDGAQTTLQMGSVVEANGEFKFVSYTRD